MSKYNPEQFTPHHDWHECVIDDACEIAALMGWDISPKDVQFTGFWSQGDGASFTGTLGYKRGCAKAVHQYAPRDTELHDIAQRWQALQARNFYQLRCDVVRIGHHYVHENSVNVECEHADDSYRALPIGTDDDAADIARDFMRWIYRALEREYEYQTAWEHARGWEDCATNAQEALTRARAALVDYRHALRADIPPSARATLKAAIRAALEEWSDALETRAEIADNFHYWDDGKRVSIEQFAKDNM